MLNISLPPLNPSASMRARQDEDNDKAPARPSIDTCGWDPEHQNGLLLLRPTLLHRDATTTVLNIRVPFPPLNPSASMRARQDEDNDSSPHANSFVIGPAVIKHTHDDALDRPSIDTCGWDSGKDDAEAGLSYCETVFACPDYDLLLLLLTLLHRDVTTTEMNIRVPLPPLNPPALMCARQDEDNVVIVLILQSTH